MKKRWIPILIAAVLPVGCGTGEKVAENEKPVTVQSEQKKETHDVSQDKTAEEAENRNGKDEEKTFPAGRGEEPSANRDGAEKTPSAAQADGKKSSSGTEKRQGQVTEEDLLRIYTLSDGINRMNYTLKKKTVEPPHEERDVELKDVAVQLMSSDEVGEDLIWKEEDAVRRVTLGQMTDWFNSLNPQTVSAEAILEAVRSEIDEWADYKELNEAYGTMTPEEAAARLSEPQQVLYFKKDRTFLVHMGAGLGGFRSDAPTSPVDGSWEISEDEIVVPLKSYDPLTDETGPDIVGKLYWKKNDKQYETDGAKAPYYLYKGIAADGTVFIGE